MKGQRCPISRKVRHQTRDYVWAAARLLALDMNRQGVLFRDAYAYRCPGCRGWHLTSHHEHNGRPNDLVLRAAPVELQRWAMGDAR